MNVFENHQKRIALATLKLHKVGASVLGGMTHQQAVSYLKKMGTSEQTLQKWLKEYGHSPEDVAEFMKDPCDGCEYYGLCNERPFNKQRGCRLRYAE